MNNFTSTEYKPVLSIKDDTFEVDQISRYLLSLQVNERRFRIAINTTEKNRCLFLEEFELGDVRYSEQLFGQLEEIYHNHHLLQAGFWNKVIVSVNHSRFTLMPRALFDPSEAAACLQLNCAVEEDEQVLHTFQNSNDAVNIFPVEEKLIGWFQDKYPNTEVQFVHQTAAFIEGVMKGADYGQDTGVYVDIDQDFATICILKNRQLEFCNVFEYRTPTDLLYYIMFLYDTFKLSQEETPAYLWGMISGQDDLFFKRIYEFIRHVHFGERPSTFYFGYLFDEVEDHKYFNVLSTPLCE